MEFNKIAVVGGGTMGNGIAHVFALKGFHVNLIEMSEELVRKAIKTIEGNLDRQLKKQLIDEKSKSDALARISPIVGLEYTPGEVDLVIEAMYENKDAKISLFNKLQNIIKQESIFASNTSSISITELASASRPDKFIGMHFMNPVPVMKLGMNHPMGPLTLADFIGLDVCLAIMEVLYNGFNDSKYRPCPLLKKMVAARKLGRKTGEGFFKYK